MVPLVILIEIESFRRVQNKPVRAISWIITIEWCKPDGSL